MKPTSVIFLILSIILIAAGIITCYAADNIAKANGIDLLYSATDEDNNVIDTHDFSKNAIDKLSVNIENANIYVYGQSDESKIVLYNFNQNTITYSMNNKTISIESSGSFVPLFKITDNGISFNSLRNLMFSSERQVENKSKKIEIYLSESDNIKNFSINLSSGNIILKNLNQSADYNLSVDSGNISMFNVSTTSKLDVNLAIGDLELRDVSFANAVMNVDYGNISQNITDNGKLSYEYSTSNGSISVNNTKQNKVYRITSDDVESSLTAEVENGDIILEYFD